MKFKQTNGQLGDSLRCAEIFGGNGQSERNLSLPGMHVQLRAVTHANHPGGGDLHYLTTCGHAMMSRITLADIAGHGCQVAATANRLKKLIANHIEDDNQQHFAAALNARFNLEEPAGTYATALLITYNAVRREISIVNAGHPHPLYYRQRTQSWHTLQSLAADHASTTGNLPLGITNDTEYSDFKLEVEQNDALILYTDGVTDSNRKQTGRSRSPDDLIDVANDVAPTDDARLSRVADQLLADHRDDDDDATFIAIRFDHALVPTRTAADRFNTWRHRASQRAA